MKFVKTFESFYKIFETFNVPKKIKFQGIQADVTDLTKDSPEAIDYLNAIVGELEEQNDAEKLSIKVQKTAKANVTKEELDEYDKKFKDVSKPLEVKVGSEVVLFYKGTTLSEILKSDKTAKDKIEKLKKDVTDWNTKNGSVFKFENGKGDVVNNKEESDKALNELKTVFNANKDFINSVGITFEGHTSSSGETAANQKLSEERTKTVKNIFVAANPDSKNWNISTLGKGETELINKDDSTEEKAQQNRRVVVKIEIDPKSIEEKPDVIKSSYNIVFYILFVGKSPEFITKITGEIKPWVLKKVGSAKSRIQCPIHIKK